MADSRNATNQFGRQFEFDSNARMDLIFRSESPRVQQMILHQNLREEIEKNSAGKVRYVDSELYFKNHQRSLGNSGASGVQNTALNVSQINNTATTNLSSANQVIKKATNSRIPTTSASTLTKVKDLIESDFRLDPAVFNLNNDIHNTPEQQCSNLSSKSKLNPNCQICLIKEVRQGLFDFNRMVQERNEQMLKLKAQCLKSYVEKQVME